MEATEEKLTRVIKCFTIRKTDEIHAWILCEFSVKDASIF